MANINNFVMDNIYRMNVINKINLFRKFIKKQNKKNYSVNHISEIVNVTNAMIIDDSNTNIDCSNTNIDCSNTNIDCSNTNIKNEFYLKIKSNNYLTNNYLTNNYDVDQLHRYEKNIVIILKILMKKYDDIKDVEFTEFYFGCKIKDFGMKFGNKYNKDWIYLINIKMLINEKILDYHYQLHHINDYYCNKQHIIAYDNEFIGSLSDEDFFAFDL
jgi:hypothetical protein